MVFGPTKPSKSLYFTHLATFQSQIPPTNSVDEAFDVMWSFLTTNNIEPEELENNDPG
jgi:hypothetical protein